MNTLRFLLPALLLASLPACAANTHEPTLLQPRADRGEAVEVALLPFSDEQEQVDDYVMFDNEGGVPLSISLVARLQRALMARHYYEGVVDGLLGDKTQEAIYLFQLDADLPLTGGVNAGLVQMLALPAPHRLPAQGGQPGQ